MRNSTRILSRFFLCLCLLLGSSALCAEACAAMGVKASTPDTAQKDTTVSEAKAPPTKKSEEQAPEAKNTGNAESPQATETSEEAPRSVLAGVVAGGSPLPMAGKDLLGATFNSLFDGSSSTPTLPVILAPGLQGMAVLQDSSTFTSGVPQSGLPSTSIGGLEEALLPIGGMSQSLDGFPPFFGDGEGTDSPTQPTSDGGQALLGTWGAHSSGQNLDLTFFPGGRCLIVANGNRIEGSYAISGNQLSLQFANGQASTLTFRIEGSFLILSDGSRLERQGQPTGTEGGCTPPPPPLPQPQSLEGAWVAGNGQTMIIMMFMNGICGLTVNGQQFFGPYTVQGNTLTVQFNNGKRLETTFSISGDTLRFADGTTLTRQNIQGPGTGTQDPRPVPLPPSTNNPLEGVWAARLPNGVVIAFVFRGNQYFFLNNGQQTETGTFVLNGNRLEYTITSGQSQGQQGVNTWQISGNVLVLTLPNGAQMQFTRQKQQGQ